MRSQVVSQIESLSCSSAVLLASGVDAPLPSGWSELVGTDGVGSAPMAARLIRHSKAPHGTLALDRSTRFMPTWPPGRATYLFIGWRRDTIASALAESRTRFHRGLRVAP